MKAKREQTATEEGSTVSIGATVCLAEGAELPVASVELSLRHFSFIGCLEGA